MKMRYMLPLAAILLIVNSCGNAGLSGNRLNAVFKNNDGIVRGIEMGDSFEKVKQAEQAADPEIESDNIIVEQDIDEESDYTVSYFFDENGVYEIDVDVFVEGSTDADDLYEQINKRLNGQFGTATEDADYLTWHGKSKRGLSVEVTLSKDSDDSGHYININYYELEGDEKE